MDSNQWNIVNKIFFAAVEMPASERALFVISASDGDPVIRNEVEQLLIADTQAGSYLDSSPVHCTVPYASCQQLKKGDVLCGRFHIYRFLGEGGMGQVYEAVDAELRDRVALKVIRPDVARHPEGLLRFRREVRLARQVTHPNICRTFDIEIDHRASDPRGGEDPPSIFLTMEFLDGETLASRIASEGPLPIPLALSLAKQIASGIEAAHSRGVIHRDLKPANVMLVPSSCPEQVRGVITDFGLARTATGQSHSGQLKDSTSMKHPIGTLAYMAPEQLEGGPVSKATDVYAFGLILFEIITGKQAFPSDHLLIGLAKRLDGVPPSPESYVPNISKAWSAAIQQALIRQPDKRPQSVSDVIYILDGRESPTSTLPGLSSGHTQKHFAMHASFSLSILISLVALFALGIRIVQKRTIVAVNQGALIYVAPVQNSTGEAALKNVSELIEAGLSQSVQVQLVDHGRAGDAIQAMGLDADGAMSTAAQREVGMRTGAVRIVFPSVSGDPRRYTLTIDIEQPSSDPNRSRNRWTHHFSWKAGDGDTTNRYDPMLLMAVRSADEWIRHEVGESPRDIANLDVPPEDVTTPRWDALQEFTKAETLQRKQATSDAILALHNAVRLDPGFCLAWARLGDLLFSNGQFKEGYLAYSHAISPTEFRRLSRKERDRIKGTFANDTGDFGAAAEAYRDYAVYYDSDYQGWFYQGYPLLMLGRYDEAVRALKKAYSIDLTRGNAPWELARAGLMQSDLETATTWASILAKQGDVGTSSYLNGVVDFANRDYSAAAASFLAVSRSTRIEDHSWSYWLIANLQAEVGDDVKALDSLEAGIHAARASGNFVKESDNLIAEANIRCNARDELASLASLRRSLELDSSPQRVTLISEVVGHCSFHSVRREKSFARFLYEIDHLTSGQHYGIVGDIAHHRLQGEIDLIKGDSPAAMKHFLAAAAIDSNISDREYLGRAYEALANRAKDKRKVSEYRRKAMDAFGFTAFQPQLSWVQSTSRLPGSYAYQVREFLSLSILEGRRDTSVGQLLSVYISLRPNSLSSDPAVRKYAIALGIKHST